MEQKYSVKDRMISKPKAGHLTTAQRLFLLRVGRIYRTTSNTAIQVLNEYAPLYLEAKKNYYSKNKVQNHICRIYVDALKVEQNTRVYVNTRLIMH